MKLTYNWLKDFLEIKITPGVLADKLTMAGLEVKSVEERDGDFVFEVEITSNRPDWLSIVGVAREVAAITNTKRKTQSVKPQSKIKNFKRTGNGFKIEIEDKKDCPIYSAKIIKNVIVGSSPDWLRKRLELIGCRSINNIVDIANYVLFTYGEPLHAFDLDRLVNGLAGEPVSRLGIIVRRARNKEELVTIDGMKRILNEDVLIIASDTNPHTRTPAHPLTGTPIAIAGVMGGKDTEVSFATKNILLESAIFNPLVIRRGRRKLGLQTDSSYRFERGVDFETIELATDEAVKLILDLAGGQLYLAKSEGLTKGKNKIISFDINSAARILGIDIPVIKIKNILNHLGFGVQPKGKSMLSVKIPAFRQDVNLEIDLIEEIARIFGYENIPISLPSVFQSIPAKTTGKIVFLIKNMLIGLGLNEVITYSLIERNLLKDFSFSSGSLVEIQNPLSLEQEILRPIIGPSLAKCVAYNLNQKQSCVNIFEIAKTFFYQSQQGIQEELVLGIALCGEKSMLLENCLIKEEMGLLHLKGILEIIFERLGIKDANFKMIDSAHATVNLGEEKIGTLLKLEKNILARLDIKNKEVVVAEIALDRLFSRVNLNKKFMALPMYPGISRDISFVIKEDVKLEDIFKVIKENASSLLQQMNVVDFYQGKQIPAGLKGLTVSCLYRSNERTLTEEEVNPMHVLVSKTLIEKFGAQIR